MDLIAHLKRGWMDGSLETGREIFDLIPDKAQFLRDLIALVADAQAESDEHHQLFLETRELVLDPARWKEGHRLSDRVRKKAIAEERAGNPDPQKVAVLWFVELIGRVAYNLSHPQDPFDEDNGWYLIKSMRDKNGCIAKTLTIADYWAVIEKQFTCKAS